MKILEFIEAVNSGNSSVLNIDLYLPVIEKKRIAMDIVSACTDAHDGYVFVDKFKMSIYLDMMFVDAYTDMDVSLDFDEMMQQYDELCQNNTLTIIKNVCDTEYETMRNVLQCVLDELLDANSIEAQLAAIASTILDTIRAASNQLNNLDITSILPDGVDVNELINTIKKLK